MVYNVKGFPRGVTVVTFMRAGDAAKARERYDGKVIDGSAYTLFLECFYHASYSQFKMLCSADGQIPRPSSLRFELRDI